MYTNLLSMITSTGLTVLATLCIRYHSEEKVMF
jgi:hypothetical protein